MDEAYEVSPLANIFFVIPSAIVLSLIITAVTEWFMVKKARDLVNHDKINYEEVSFSQAAGAADNEADEEESDVDFEEEEDELRVKPEEQKGLAASGIALLIFLAGFFALLFIPGSPLASQEDSFMESPLISAIAVPIALAFLVCGIVYGIYAGTLKSAPAEINHRLAQVLDQVRSLRAEQEKIAHELYGSDCSVRSAMRKLNHEDRYTLRGTDALVEWMQSTADGVIAELNGKEFDIPEEVEEIECCIDPAGTGGIFYTSPSDDFSRPGRMWWSVPAGQELFHTWQELTTVHHEGAPGHHLQIGAALTQPDLNLWRRAVTWNSGHGEGWALYAEALMAELGYMDDPGFRMGLLDAQRFRAARVVVEVRDVSFADAPSTLVAATELRAVPIRSAFVTSSASAKAAPQASRLPWVRTAPFGEPVVPEV